MLPVCAQRLTASMVSARTKGCNSLQHTTVLNALRHQWFRHCRRNKIALFEIKVLNALRHQWFRHHPDPAIAGEVSLCSTPYGINGFGTLSSTQRQRGRDVLNALRHQWFRHPTRAPPHESRTIVLNALRHQWFRHNWRKGRTTLSNRCSTPYGINGFGTLTEPGGSHAIGECSTPYGINGFGTAKSSSITLGINKCSTPYGINGFGTIAEVFSFTKLFRAQRLTASMVSALISESTGGLSWSGCSTPYGINGFGTLAMSYRAALLPDVLNALRHQWFRHNDFPQRSGLAIMCSTPYGINGFGTFRSI